MKKHGKQTLLALAMALVLLFSQIACGERQQPAGESEAPGELSESDFVFLNPITELGTPGLSDILEDLRPLATESYEINTDTVGWLRMPGTTIDNVVVCYPGDNNKFYLDRDLEKRKNTNGTYFADYRSSFDGTAGGMSRNTVIYGHSFNDNPEGSLFSQTKKYLDEDFALENPYIYFSTPEENMAWEVFAVFYATVDLPYNLPQQSDAEFSEMINECIKRSRYIYDTEITANDKIITLSTCTYLFTSTYPNDYRYVVMARLVGNDETLKETATFEVNPDPKAP